MANPIPYTIKKGDTLSSIAREKKINSWKDLQVYHNQNCPKEEMIGTTLKEGKTLYVPSQDEIDEMNGVKKNPASETETKPEEKKQEEKPKEEQKKEEKKEDSKSEHDGKYYVVHGATCVCDKAEDPTKEAELQVTTHQKMIYNDQAKKWAATEEDKQFNPPAATFGKCKLKPSSSGYLPCALAPAPKWNKPYDKTKVMGKSVLTEISELQCTVGGKITIKKHGQTDAASTAHAQNTNPAEMAHANPAVKKPTPKADFPMVNFITLETVENRPTFKPIKSSDSKNNVEKIYVRPNENCSFTANVSKGNKSLTSWVIYDGFEGKSDQKTLTKEQIGPSFSNSFPALGNFRVEGYGKPKTKEYENGKYDKNDATCSIDVTVAINTLVENQLEMYGEDFAATIKQEVRLRKDFPAAFKAKFLMPPTPEELARLEMYVTDEAGNRLSDYLHEGKRLTYTPTNADTVYIFHAVYHDEQGNPHKQTFKGKTLTKNYVVTISNTDQVVREFSPIGFEVKKMSIGSFIAADSDLTQSEIQDIKWNLNGVYQNSGRVLSIPRGLPIGKYVVEAFCSMANAYGAKAKKEDDDRHFEVKRNDVVEIQSDPILKVGKKATFTASGFVFKDLLPNEKVNWTLDQQSLANSKTMVTTFRSVGRTTVTAKINAEKGITKTFTVVQPILENVMFTDSQGIQIEKSSWGNKVNIWLKEKYVTGEKLKISLVVGTTPVYHFPEKVYDGGLIELHLNDDIRKYAKNEATLKVVVNATELDLPNEGKPLGALEVSYAREVYSGQIGTEDGKKKHSPVDYDMVSWFYGKSRGIKDTEKVTIEIWEDNFLIDEKLLSGEASPDKSGALRFKIDWGKIPKGKQGSFKKVYAKVIDNNQNKTVLFDGDALFTKNYTPLMAKSTVNNLTGYSSAAIVGSATNTENGTKTGNCYCNRDFTEEEFTKIFNKLRDSEPDVKRGSGYKVFGASNCDFSESDKTLKRLLEEINKVNRKYGINNCIQKIHFLSQIYWESDRFRTALEYASGNGYNPGQHAESEANGNTQIGDGPKYKGRGLMQLTWRKNHIKYLQYSKTSIGGELSGKTDAQIENRDNNYEKLISDKLSYAVDSAAWFWVIFGKATFTSKKNKEKYQEILDKNLNDISLFIDKYQERISVIVNGGGNGKEERKGYYNELKKIMEFSKCTNNKEAKPSTGSTSSSKIVFFDDGLTTERRTIVGTKTIEILEKAAENSSNEKVIITSTIRSTRKQAEVMYENESNGNSISYAQPGREVIKVYNDGVKDNLSKEQIISKMDTKIQELSKEGKRVSLHCVAESEYKKKNIIDVSFTRGITKSKEFIDELEKEDAVTRIIHPISGVKTGGKISFDSKEPAIHIEINQ